MEIVPFNYKESQIRVVKDENEELWFVAKDICDALGYSNARDALNRHCDNGDVVKRDTPSVSGIQKMNYVNESGMYALIFGSTLDTAKVFKKWVTSEVLPTIRKTGSYSTPTLSPTMEDLLLRQNALLAEALRELRLTQEAVIDAKDETIQIQREAMEMLANVAPKNVTINNSVKTNTRYSLRMGNTSGEELFINAVKMTLMREPDGITQGELLTSLGKSKADKTALRWLHTNVGIHWNMIPVGRHNFFVITNAMRGVA